MTSRQRLPPDASGPVRCCSPPPGTPSVRCRVRPCPGRVAPSTGRGRLGIRPRRCAC